MCINHRNMKADYNQEKMPNHYTDRKCTRLPDRLAFYIAFSSNGESVCIIAEDTCHNTKTASRGIRNYCSAHTILHQTHKQFMHRDCFRLLSLEGIALHECLHQSYVAFNTLVLIARNQSPVGIGEWPAAQLITQLHVGGAPLVIQCIIKLEDNFILLSS